MSLFEFFFPEQAQAEHLREIASHQRRSLYEKKLDETRQEKRLTQLENDVGTMALILGSIIKKLDETGQIDRTDLKNIIKEMDLLDDVRDGKISVEHLRRGDFLSEDK